MNEIKAFIRPERLSEVTMNLREENFCCFTVFQGEGVGDYTDSKTDSPSLNFQFMHSKVIKMEIVCEKEDVDKIVNIIKVSARTGKSGDGLIYVSDVEQRIKIRTGEKESR